MNEEKAVLDFFVQQENLPLALAVGEKVDEIRLHMNNDFWRRLEKRAAVFAPQWHVHLTEDQNTDNCLVGLYLRPVQQQAVFLMPMLEQQRVGETLRIYFGLIWGDTPRPDQAALPEVTALRDAMQHAGFKNNEKFLAWQWSPYHPRNSTFLLRFSETADALLDEVISLLRQLDTPRLAAANAALKDIPQHSVVSLDALRNSLKRS